MVIDLTRDERDMVISLLDTAIADARQEIYRTESFEFKESLRRKKNLMEALLLKLVGTEETRDCGTIQYH